MSISDKIAKKRAEIEELEATIARIEKKIREAQTSGEKQKFIREIREIERQKREAEFELHRALNEKLNELEEQLREKARREQEERLKESLPPIESFRAAVCSKCAENTTCDGYLRGDRQKMLPCILSRLLIQSP